MSDEPSTTTSLLKNWPMHLMLALGFGFVALGAWVGQNNDVIHRFMLDMKGTRGVGTAEAFGANQYRLRFTQDTGIYSRLYKGSIPGAPAGTAEFQVPIVFDPTDPGRFLPAGLSYKPAFLAGGLFVIGMACALTARRVAVAAERMQRLARLKAAENQQRAEKSGDPRKSKHRKHHRHHSERHGQSAHHSAGR